MTRLGYITLLASVLSACSAPVIKGTLFENATLPGAGVASLALSKDDMIVVLSAESTGKDESWPAACVRDAIAGTDQSISMMTPSAFRDATFPWFETHDVEAALAEVKTLPSISKAVQQIGVRYIISVTGETTASALDDSGLAGGGSGGAGAGLGYVGKHGLMLCALGPTGGGCLGFMAWQRTSDLSAFVWDIKRGVPIGAIAAKVTGTNLMPAFVLPVPLIAPTETAACSKLGYHVGRFVTTGEIPESTAADVATDVTGTE